MFSYLFLMVFALQAIATPQSLLGLVKSNPQALVNVTDKADPQEVAKIINILRSMISENNGTIADLAADLKKAKEDVEKAQTDFDDQEGKCKGLSADLDDATDKEDEATGEYNQALATYNARKPVLDAELTTLRMVLTKLQSLLPVKTQIESTPRKLLSLSAESALTAIKEDPSAFLESFADANPKKVQSAIDLVQELINDASGELEDVTKEKNDTKTALDAASLEVFKLTESLGSCESSQGNKEQDLQEKQGILQRTTQFVVQRTKVLRAEITDILEVIRLLSTL